MTRPAGLAAVARAPWMSQLTQLRLDCASGGIFYGDRGAHRLAGLAGVPFTGMRRLELNAYCSTPLPALLTLVRAPWLAGLEELQLAGLFDDAHKEAMFTASPALRALVDAGRCGTGWRNWALRPNSGSDGGSDSGSEIGSD